MRVKESRIGVFVVWGFASFVVFGLMGWLNRKGLDVAHQRAAQARTAPGAPRAPKIRIGDSVVIRGNWNGRAFLAKEHAWDDMLEVEEARSFHLMARLIRKGDVVSIADGTEGIIVKTSATSFLVEIANGKSIGEEGWIQREFVRTVQ